MCNEETNISEEATDMEDDVHTKYLEFTDSKSDHNVAPSKAEKLTGYKSNVRSNCQNYDPSISNR